MTDLSQANLEQIAATMPVPTYPRDRIEQRIVHFGVGGFHRAHQAMYLDQLLNDGKAQGWGITGVGVRRNDARMRDGLNQQDGLFTLTLKHPEGDVEGRVIGSISNYLYATDDPQKVIDVLADPATKIVSLTITESGYPINDATGEFEATDDDVVSDLETDGPRRSALGLIVEGLRGRREAGTPPFTVMCCDNIQHNGHVAHDAVVGMARVLDADLAGWIEAEVSFPNGMVDRITPATTDEMRAEVTERFGVTDAVPVVCEAFTQWVLEDDFPAGRPEFEEVGVQMVEDVNPYEMMKLRLLNASHQQLAYAGFLAGYDLVHEAVGDPVVRAYLLDGYMRGEAVHTLPEVPGVDLDAYCAELLNRYSNEAVRDTLARLAVDGSDRLSKFLFPVINDRIAAGEPSPVCAMIIATWADFCEGGTPERPAPIKDKRADELAAAARADRAQPGTFLDQAIFGDIGRDERFRTDFVAARRLLAEVGVQEAMKRVTAASR